MTSQEVFLVGMHMSKGVQFIELLEERKAISVNTRKILNRLIDFGQWEGSFVALMLRKSSLNIEVLDSKTLIESMAEYGFTEERINHVSAISS